MTRAEIQARIDAGGEVSIPAGVHRLNGPLVPRSWTHVNFNGATLVPDYSGQPVIEADDTAYTVHWSIRNVQIDGRAWSCDGVVFPAAQGGYPFYCELENIQLRRCRRGFHDAGSGAFQVRLVRVWAMECQYGFARAGGTTCLFDTCFAGSAGETMRAGWELWATNADVLRNCAMDNHVAEPGRPACHLFACEGLTIDGGYMEGNRASGGPLIVIQDCDGFAWRGLQTLGSRLEPPAGRAAYLVQWHNSRGELTATMGGGDRRMPDLAEGDPSGHTVTLFVTGNRTRLRLNGVVNPADRQQPQQTRYALAYGLGATPAHVDARGCQIGEA